MSSHTVPIEAISDAIVAEYTVPIPAQKTPPVPPSTDLAKKKPKKKRR